MYQSVLDDHIKLYRNRKLLNDRGFVNGFCSFFQFWVELKESWNRFRHDSNPIEITDWVMAASHRKANIRHMMRNVIADDQISNFFPITSFGAQDFLINYFTVDNGIPLYFLIVNGNGKHSSPHCSIGIFHRKPNESTCSLSLYEPVDRKKNPCSAFRYLYRCLARGSNVVRHIDAENSTNIPLIVALKFLAKVADEEESRLLSVVAEKSCLELH